MTESLADPEESSGSESYHVEPLATSRTRRSTAGRLMSTLLDAEADDELARIFAEEEDDEEFESGDGEDEEDGGGAAAGAAEDMDLDSSSSDEGTQGPDAAGNEELEGEKELERQEKAKRAKKRTAQQEGFRIPALRKKKVKIDPTLPTRTSTLPAPRYRKKSERISWLPTADDGPTRASSRRQTMQNRVQTHARLKRSEQKRVQLIATMEETAKRKEKYKPKQMTQADRLAEAEKTERLNYGSLSRWEEMEEKRGEERRLKMEALHNRRLEGPVVTFWSGIAKWINEKLAMVGVRTFKQAVDADTGRKKKGRDANHEGPLSEPDPQKEKATDSAAAQNTLSTSDGQSSSFLDGIHLYASMQETTAPPYPDNGTAEVAATNPALPAIDAPAHVAADAPLPSAVQQKQGSTADASSDQTVTAVQTASTGPRAVTDKEPGSKPAIERSSRTCIILDNFDVATAPGRSDVGILYNPKKPAKLSKSQHEFCPIVSRPARYRDPMTGLPYSNSLAYREIRQVLAHRYAWSGTFGCFVGPIGVGARGVPERFLAPNAAPPQQLFGPLDVDGKKQTVAPENTTADNVRRSAGEK